jgi:hypothetical protein
MCLLPCKTKKGPCTHRLIHPTFIREVAVTQDNIAEIAAVLGIHGAELKPGGTLHVIHEATTKKPKKPGRKR